MSTFLIRSGRAVVVLLAMSILAAGCSTAPSSAPYSASTPSIACPDGECSSTISRGFPASHSSSTNSSAALARWSLEALGDSVPSGANCNCNPYPDLLARGLSTRKAPVAAVNDAADGSTSADVLSELSGDREVIAHVRAAKFITIEIGANDIPYSTTCGTTASCYLPGIPSLRRNLSAIMSRIHALTAGHKVLVVLLDYWSVWLGGKYAAAQGADYVATADKVTDAVNGVIKSIAAGAHARYVDLRAAFKGPHYSDDETRFLSDDGDHPSASGHQLIAKAAQRVITSPLKP